MGGKTWDWKNLTTADDLQGEHEPLVDYNTDSAQGGSTEGEPDGHDDSDLNMGFDDPDEQLSNVHYVGSGEFVADPPAPDVDTQATLENIAWNRSQRIMAVNIEPDQASDEGVVDEIRLEENDHASPRVE